MEKDKESRGEAYPRPSTQDEQLKNQQEFIDSKPNSFEKKIEDAKVTTQTSTEDESKLKS